jgi:hypothetical protein
MRGGPSCKLPLPLGHGLMLLPMAIEDAGPLGLTQRGQWVRFRLLYGVMVA